MAFADSNTFELEPLGPEPHEISERHAMAQQEDLYWSGNYWREPYYCADYDYEDYAPAYCVGYTGCAQYGGQFDDAETSLCANFVRIKGDSRLTWEEAREPILAAWNRVHAGRTTRAEPKLGRLFGRMPPQAPAVQEACAA